MLICNIHYAAFTDKSDIRIRHFAHINVAITAMEMADIVKETDVTHYMHFFS